MLLEIFILFYKEQSESNVSIFLCRALYKLDM
jgi:hypothetical protein